MTGQRILFYSVAIDCIQALLHSYLLLCNKLSQNAVAGNIIIYLCLILNLARSQVGIVHLHPLWSVGVTHVTVFSCKLGMGWSIHDGISLSRDSVHMASNSIAWTSCMITRSIKGAFQKDKPQCASTYRALACITLANVTLAKVSHMAKPRGRWGRGYTKVWTLEVRALGSLVDNLPFWDWWWWW